MREKVKAAPTVIYPESDGKPMAETEYHRDIMIDFIQMLKHYFRNVSVKKYNVLLFAPPVPP